MKITKLHLKTMVRKAIKSALNEHIMLHEYTIPEVDDFTQQYMETALWSSSDYDGEPLERHYSVDDLSDKTKIKMIKDCKKFQKISGELIYGKEKRAGHDFWLTRNEHGVGFWDGDWDDSDGEILTTLSKRFGMQDLYVSDNDEIEIL